MTGGRVVLYRRVSALMGRGGDDFHSPEMQTSAMRRHIANLGLREVGQVEDIDVSGRTFNREGLDEIRALVEDGKIDAIAVYDLSRLGRNAGESLTFIKWLRERRVSVLSTVEKVDDTPEGQLTLTLWLAIAELYSNQIGRRWADVVRRRAGLGIQHGSKPAPGYVREEKGKLVIDSVAGPAVRRAIAAYAAGEPVAKIRDGYGAETGHYPAMATIKRIVANPVYLGKVVLWDRERQRNFNWKDKPLYIGDGLHEPLTDQATFDACQARLKRDSITAPRLLAPRHSLSGLVRCAECGAAMIAAKDGRDPSVVRLRCGRRGHYAQQARCPGSGTPLLSEIEDAVLSRIREYVAKLTADMGKARRAVVPAKAPDGRPAIQEQIEALEKKTAKLVERWLDGGVPDAAYEANLSRLREQEGKLRERLEHAAAPVKVPSGPEIVALADQLVRLWPDAEPQEKRLMIGRVVQGIRVRGSRRWREPVGDRVEVLFP